MTQLSAHFVRAEFACKCGCGSDTVDAELLRVLDHARMHWMVPVTINSGFRCQKHNKLVGGSPCSRHMQGKAADISVRGIFSYTVAEWLDAQFPEKYGIGRYPTWVHIDVRPEMARWAG